MVQILTAAQSWNLVCIDLLMNPDHTTKIRSPRHTLPGFWAIIVKTDRCVISAHYWPTVTKFALHVHLT